MVLEGEFGVGFGVASGVGFVVGLGLASGVGFGVGLDVGFGWGVPSSAGSWQLHRFTIVT